MKETTADKAYAIYTFIDEKTAKDLGIKEYTLAPNLVTIIPIRRKLFALALKRFFNVELDDRNIMSATGCYDGIYYSVSMSERSICVAMSRRPIGIGTQVPFDIPNVREYVNRYFTANEIAKCRDCGFDAEEVYRIFAEKAAFRKKYHEREFGDTTHIDTTEQSKYTLHKDSCDGRDYFFAATDDADFIKADIKDVLP